MEVEAPIYGYVFEDRVVSRNVIQVSDPIHPKVEPEIGIVLKKSYKALVLPKRTS